MRNSGHRPAEGLRTGVPRGICLGRRRDDQQHRVVAPRRRQLAQRRHQRADRPDVELADQARADAQAQRARGHQVVADQVERGLPI